MTNHSDSPILRRIFAATSTDRRDGVRSTSNTTAESFHSCKSINITQVTQLGSGWTVINGGASDDGHGDSRIEDIEGMGDISENDDDSQFEEIEGADDIPVSNNDSQLQKMLEAVEDSPANDDETQIEEIEGADDIPENDDIDSPIHRTYQFDNCHVYMNSFNASGVKVKNSGNNTPQVTHHGVTAPNEGPLSSSKLSRPSTRPKGPRNPAPAFGQSSNRHQDLSPDFSFELPPPLLFQPREDNSSYALDDSPSAPPVGIDVPFSFEQKQPKKRGKLPATVDAKLMPLKSAPTNLPSPESQLHPINPFLPIHMGLRQNLLPHILQSFPDDVQNNNTANNWNDLPPLTNHLHPHHYLPTPNSSRHCLTTESLEHHLDSALEILIQTSGRGILVDGVTLRARNTLKAINALISMETPTYDPPPPSRFKSVRKVAKWLQIPRSPK